MLIKSQGDTTNGLYGLYKVDGKYVLDRNTGYSEGKVYVGTEYNKRDLLEFLNLLLLESKNISKFRYIVNGSDYKVIRIYTYGNGVGFLDMGFLVYKEGKVHLVSNNVYYVNSTDIDYSIKISKYLTSLINLSVGDYSLVYELLKIQSRKIVDYSDDYLMVTWNEKLDKIRTNRIYYVFKRDSNEFKLSYVIKASTNFKLNLGLTDVMCGIDIITGKAIKVLMHKTNKGYLSVSEMDYKLKTINNNTSVNFKSSYVDDNSDALNIRYRTNKKVIETITEDELRFKGKVRSTWGDM